MKVLSNVLLITCLASAAVLPALAEPEHEHKSMNRSEPSTSKTVKEKMTGHVHKAMYRSAPLTAAQKEEVHQHLDEMQSLMAKIEAENDAEKHEELMQQHLTLMDQCTHVMTNGEGEMSSLSMEDQMALMEDHMGMMQAMMGQMMEHQVQANKPIHLHKRRK